VSSVINIIHMFLYISLFGKLTTAVAIAVFGLAVSHVLRPTELKLALMRPVSLASIFATISGLLGGWIALLTGIAATPDGHLPASIMYQGIGESLTVGFVSFGFLAAAWLLVGVAVMRRARLEHG
jgi:hypothetical protein